MTTTPILSIKDLDIRFSTPDGPVHAVDGINIDLMPGEILGIVGESGSGKSQTWMTPLGLLADNASVQGEVLFEGQNLIGLAPKALNQIRGKRIAMIFQDPMTSLNPYMKIGDQLVEALRLHQPELGREQAAQQCVEMLEQVAIPHPAQRFNQHPHELSGGMRQRVMIAMALLNKPDILVADEPTTALDVTVQAEILAIIKKLQAEMGMSVVFITHDLAVVANLCDRVVVMNQGEIMEVGPVDQVIHAPTHAYTQKLLAATPRMAKIKGGDAERSDAPQSLVVKNLCVNFSMPGGFLRPRKVINAVKDVSFELAKGETLAIVGESGSGKSTLARAVLRLVKPTSGQVSLNGEDLLALDPTQVRHKRKIMQMIFQDPIASLSPRRTVQQIIEEPLLVHFPQLTSQQREQRVFEYMDLMELSRSAKNRYPHEFSGGQAQRIGIARALVVDPDLLVADEPVSALDVSIQAQVLDLIAEIKEKRDLSMLFISHDLSVVRQVADRVLVMYMGEIQEIGPAAEIYDQPKADYTRKLLSAAPILDVRGAA